MSCEYKFSSCPFSLGGNFIYENTEATKAVITKVKIIFARLQCVTRICF